MRIYLEAAEQGDIDPEFIRLDVTGKSQAEQDSILTSLKDFMAGLSCKFTKHFCPHDFGGACNAEDV